MAPSQRKGGLSVKQEKDEAADAAAKLSQSAVVAQTPARLARRLPKWFVWGVCPFLSALFFAAYRRWSLTQSGVSVEDQIATLWAAAHHELDAPLQANVTCAVEETKSKKKKKKKLPPAGTAICRAPISEDKCARFVIDGAVPFEQALELRKLVEWLVAEAWGGGAGPPSVIDLHQGSISYKEKFVELQALMDFKKLSFTKEQIVTYAAVRTSLKLLVAKLFGVPEEHLLHDLTFFSQINGSKVAHTSHDEYWHSHIDTQQYGTFTYTTLLYLSTEGDDFEGGEFIFEGGETSGKEGAQSLGDGHEVNVELASGPTAVEPRFGRVVAFTSGAENAHRVLEVTKGLRIALTAAFTCDAEKGKATNLFMGQPPPPAADPLAQAPSAAGVESQAAEAAVLAAGGMVVDDMDLSAAEMYEGLAVE